MKSPTRTLTIPMMPRQMLAAASAALVMLLFANSPDARAQSSMELLVRYGESLTFSVDLTGRAIERTALFVGLGEDAPRLIREFAPETGKVSLALSPPDLGLRAVDLIHYYWVLTGADGSSVSTPPQERWYRPGGQDLQSLEAEPGLVLWLPEQHQDSSQALAAVARAQSIELLEQSGVAPARQRTLFVVESLADLVQASNLHAQPIDGWSPVLSSPRSAAAILAWDGQGVDSPALRRDLRAALLALDPGFSTPPYPDWYLSALTIGGLDQDPALNALAVDDPDGFGLTSDLCAERPANKIDPASYAAAASFSGFLRQHFGNEGIIAVGVSYRSGAGCIEGLSQALNMPPAAIEREWRNAQRNPQSDVMQPDSFLPLVSLLLMSTLMLPFAFQPGRSA